MIEWLGSLAALVAWGFALYVYWVSPRTKSSSLLVLMLFVDGLAVISSGTSWPFVDRLINLGKPFWWRVHVASDWALIGVYLTFIGTTVESSLAKPMRGPRTQLFVLIAGVIMAALMMPLQVETFRSEFAAYLYSLIALVLTWGFAAALHAWMSASNLASRARAAAFSLAFGLRDTVWMITFLITGAFNLGYLDESNTMFFYGTAVAYVSAVIVYVPLVAYGMLRTQLFDIDLRIKRTLKRSTVVAAFVAIFFLISGLAELFFSAALGNLMGILCTAGLVFFLDPIQRAAERLSNAAMPETNDTPEYENFRKLQVYESAVQAAVDDGAVPAHKRAILDALVTSLGISPEVALRLEQDALGS
ncbi:hypothetical protein [Congregibacter sp.]|uniref:hypothetical protein n=1 Tax=Congregibacter sp. TaxID=2744308 RepID=UPI003F6C1D46